MTIVLTPLLIAILCFLSGMVVGALLLFGGLAWYTARLKRKAAKAYRKLGKDFADAVLRDLGETAERKPAA